MPIDATLLDGPFAPRSLIQDREINPTKKLLWLHVMDRQTENGGEAVRVDQRELSSILKMSMNTIGRSLKSLEKLRWIKVIRSAGYANEYICCIPVKYEK